VIDTFVRRVLALRARRDGSALEIRNPASVLFEQAFERLAARQASHTEPEG
jgi:hypothetical protein